MIVQLQGSMIVFHSGGKNGKILQWMIFVQVVVTLVTSNVWIIAFWNFFITSAGFFGAATFEEKKS